MERYRRKKAQNDQISGKGGKAGGKPPDADADQFAAEGGSFDEFFIGMVARKRAAMPKNKVYDLDELSDPGSSLSQRELEEMKAEMDKLESSSDIATSSDEEEDEMYEGGSLQIPGDDFLDEYGLITRGSKSNPEYYQEKDIEDRGFNRWVDAYDRTATTIQWVALIITFKVYRLTYSYFMGRKQFLVLYQKKKFKKHTICITIMSQFLVELPLIIADVVALSSLPWGEQLILTVIDTMIIAIFLIILEFIELARLDKIMKTANTRGHKAKKSAAACEDSDDDDLLSDSDDKDDDYPDWRLMLKNVEGNAELFKTTTTQLKLNELA